MAVKVLNSKGEWEDRAASVELLPDNLRSLPAEIVGKDVDDPDKAHVLDAQHVVNTIAKDYGKSIDDKPSDNTTEKVAKKLWAPGPGERAPVRQWFVDVAKMRVIARLITKAVGEHAAGFEPNIDPCHLWFEEDNVNNYFLRMGNPPPRKERPRFLRDIDLTVDITNPPRSIVDLLKAKGIDLDFQKAIREYDNGNRLVQLA